MKEKLNELIKESMLNKTTVRTEVLRSIKTAFMNHETAKNATPLTESVEIAIIKKMVSQRRDSFNEYLKAKRVDLAEKEELEIDILLTFLPKEATIKDIENEFNVLKNSIEPSKKNMGLFIKEIKNKLNNVDGKVLSDYVKNNLV